MNEPQTKDWKVVYPAYLNSNRTLNEGRRLPKEKCVPDPRWQELKDVLEANKDFKVHPEPAKLYPREVDKELPAARGRIKYQVVANESKYPNKGAVLIYLAETIPKLKARAKGAASGGGASSSEQPAAGNKKKGKGKR